MTVVPVDGNLNENQETGLVKGSPFLKRPLSFTFSSRSPFQVFVYGKIVGHEKRSVNVIDANVKKHEVQWVYILCWCFFCGSNFVAFFKWTNLGNRLSSQRLLQCWQGHCLRWAEVFVLFILTVWLVNLSLGQCVSSVGNTAPIFVPMPLC